MQYLKLYTDKLHFAILTDKNILSTFTIYNLQNCTKKPSKLVQPEKTASILKLYKYYAAKADPIKKVAAKATIAYNSGNTAKIKVLPNTLCP